MKKCWSKKNFIGHKKFVDPEFFHPKKNLVQQNFESEDIFYPKKLKSKKYLCLKKFRSKKLFKKINWALSPKILGSQNFWSKKFG